MQEEAFEEADSLIVGAVALVDEAERRGIHLRVAGGVAVAIHSPSAAHGSLERQYGDIDFVTSTSDGRQLDGLVESVGYAPEKRFNSIHGKRRRIYTDRDSRRQIDIFMSEFRMCHSLPLGDRLEADSPTIPLADLFLTKAQIVELNRKDELDLYALLVDHDLGVDDDDRINIDWIARLCGADWGLWRTTIGTLGKLEADLGHGPSDDALRETVGNRIAELRRVLNDAPKTRRWRARARLGERRQWYEVPEDALRRGSS